MKKGFHLEISDAQAGLIDELMEVTGITTKKELFSNSLTLFEWAVKEKRLARIIASIDTTGNIIREVIMPALSNAQPSIIPPKSNTSQSSTDPPYQS